MGFFTIALPSAIFASSASAVSTRPQAKSMRGRRMRFEAQGPSFEEKVSCRPDRSSSPDATKMNPVILYSVFVPIVLLVCWDSGGSMVNVAGQ